MRAMSHKNYKNLHQHITIFVCVYVIGSVNEFLPILLEEHHH